MRWRLGKNSGPERLRIDAKELSARPPGVFRPRGELQNTAHEVFIQLRGQTRAVQPPNRLQTGKILGSCLAWLSSDTSSRARTSPRKAQPGGMLLRQLFQKRLELTGDTARRALPEPQATGAHGSAHRTSQSQATLPIAPKKLCLRAR